MSLLKAQFWIEVDAPLAADLTWRSVFQAQAEHEARAHNYVGLGEAQVADSDVDGKKIIFWEVT